MPIQEADHDDQIAQQGNNISITAGTTMSTTPNQEQH